MLIPPSARRSRVAHEPTRFAWQVHAAMESWTARVDLKASVLLAFQGGAFIFAATTGVEVVKGAGTAGVVLAAIGMALLVAAMGMAAAAVMPILGSARRHRSERNNHLVYFGHLRHWQADELAARLARLSGKEEARMLALQLVGMSRLNWRKHRFLQASVGLTLLAPIALGVAIVLSQVYG